MTSQSYDSGAGWLHVPATVGRVLAGFAIAFAIASCDSGDTPAADDVGEQGPAQELPQEELVAAYASLSGLVAEAKTADVFQRFTAEQAGVSVVDDRLVVYAAGDDASLILPRFAAGKRFIVQVVINSPVETTAQLYYLTNGQTKYRESQSQIAKLVPGRNVVYFRVDAPNVIDPIRFDPSAAPGEYTIESMTAMGLPRGGTP